MVIDQVGQMLRGVLLDKALNRVIINMKKMKKYE